MQQIAHYRYRVLVFLFLLTTITYLDRISISLVGVRIKSEFHLSNSQFGWVVGIFALAYASFEIPSGAYGDRIGQRAVFIRIVIWWSLFTALTGATTGLISLLIVRFLFGMGESGTWPNGSAVISHWFPFSETSRGITALNVGATAGAAIAPLIVVPLAYNFGWRAPFFVNGLIGLVWVLVCYLWFRNNPSEKKSVTQEEKNYIEETRRFNNHKQRFNWKTAFKNRSLWCLCIAYYCDQWVIYFSIAWLSIFLQEGRHFSEHHMQQVISGSFAVSIVGMLFGGFLCDWLVKRKGVKFGRRFVAMFSLSMNAALILVIAITQNNTILIWCLVVKGFFYWGSTAAFSTCIDISGNKAGTVAGIMNFFGQMGALTLAIIFGVIVDFTHNYNAPLFVLSGVLFTGCLLWLFVDPGKPLTIENKDSDLSSITIISDIEKSSIIVVEGG